MSKKPYEIYTDPLKRTCEITFFFDDGASYTLPTRYYPGIEEDRAAAAGGGRPPLGRLQTAAGRKRAGATDPVVPASRIQTGDALSDVGIRHGSDTGGNGGAH